MTDPGGRGGRAVGGGVPGDAGSGDPALRDPALDELRDAILGGDLVFCVGAGIAAAAGLPSWGRLVGLLLGYARARGIDAAIVAEIEELATRRRFVDALTASKTALGEGDFGRELERHLDDRGKKVPEVARAIAALAPQLRAVLTTNVDHLLERALGGEWPMLVRAPGDLAQRRGYILKLHGTLLDRSTWALTRDAEARAIYEDPRVEGAFAALFHACPMLFVGYGVDDDDFDQLLARVRGFAGDPPPRHFALVAAGAIKPFRRRELTEAGVRVILCDDHDDALAGTTRVLRALGFAPTPSAAPSGAAPSGDAPGGSPRRSTSTPPPKAPPPRPSTKGPQPPGAPYNRSWYIHREEEEGRALSYLETAGAPVVLWAPELCGKTTMLRYLLDHVREQDAAEGRQGLVIDLDLGELLPSEPTLSGLLESMARSIAQQTPGGDEAWVDALARSPDAWPRKLQRLLQKYVLPAAGDRLFLVIERADAVWGQRFQGELYGLLRAMCELGHKEPWDRLRMLIALSTTPSLVLDGPDGSRSPWNLVPPIELAELGIEQVEALARLYQLDWSRQVIEERIYPLVGGHPHHLRTLMYKACLRKPSLDALLTPSSLEALFGQHFTELIRRLERDPALEEAMIHVLHDPRADLDDTIFQRLLGAGLLTRAEGSGYRVRYRLDDTYLRERWLSKRVP